MAFLRLPASMLLLASFLLLLYGTTSSADQSHDLPLAKRSHDLPLAKGSHDLPLAKGSHDLPLAKRSHDLPLAKRALAFPAKRVKRDMEPDTEAQIKNFNTEAASHSKKLVQVFQVLASFGKLLPGFAGGASSFLDLALSFVPKDDPLQKGFDELNRKLDSLSLQVSDLVNDVEWNNFISSYHDHELNIIHSWDSYTEMISKPSGKELDKLITSYLDNFRPTEVSVDKLYYLLTMKGISLARNLNDLLTDRVNCDIREMRKWNMHLSGLMFKGIILKQLHQRLMDPSQPVDDTKHRKMLEDVYNAQKAAIRNCLDKSEEYMKTDVKKKALSMDHNNKEAIAEEVKTFLDEKYFWYDWVVVVYDSSQKANYAFYDMTTVEVGSIQVTVGYTQAVEQEKKVREDGEKVNKCYNKKYETIYESRRRPEVVDVTKCEDIKKEISECNVNEFVKVTHISFGENHAQAPKPLRTFECRHWFAWNALKGYVSRIHVYYSKEAGDPCTENPCENQEKCERLVKSNEHLCE